MKELDDAASTVIHDDAEQDRIIDGLLASLRRQSSTQIFGNAGIEDIFDVGNQGRKDILAVPTSAAVFDMSVGDEEPSQLDAAPKQLHGSSLSVPPLTPPDGEEAGGEHRSLARPSCQDGSGGLESDAAPGLACSVTTDSKQVQDDAVTPGADALSLHDSKPLPAMIAASSLRRPVWHELDDDDDDTDSPLLDGGTQSLDDAVGSPGVGRSSEPAGHLDAGHAGALDARVESSTTEALGLIVGSSSEGGQAGNLPQRRQWQTSAEVLQDDDAALAVGGSICGDEQAQQTPLAKDPPGLTDDGIHDFLMSKSTAHHEFMLDAQSILPDVFGDAVDDPDDAEEFLDLPEESMHGSTHFGTLGPATRLDGNGTPEALSHNVGSFSEGGQAGNLPQRRQQTQCGPLPQQDPQPPCEVTLTSDLALAVVKELAVGEQAQQTPLASVDRDGEQAHRTSLASDDHFPRRLDDDKDSPGLTVDDSPVGAFTSLGTLAALEKLANQMDPGPIKDALATFVPAHRRIIEAWHADNPGYATQVATERARQTPHAQGTQASSSRPLHALIGDRP